MNLEIVKDMTAMARRAADLIVQAIHVNPTLVLGLATGSTQIRLYKELVRRYRQRQVDFAGVRTFNLDEYVGIAADHSHSYRYFMDNHFFRHVNLQKTNIYMLAGTTSNPTRHCEAYEENIRLVGGIDLQLLGLGVNGHIAFCEPGIPFHSETMLVDLDKETIRQNSDGRFYKREEEVPKQALTMGLRTIMAARKIIMLANGPRKAVAVKKALVAPPSIDVPASVLQRHAAVTWLLEREAASELPPSLVRK